MKILKLSKRALTGFAILLSTSAFAADKGSIQVGSPVNVAGHRLAAGEYTVEWGGTGPIVELTILHGHTRLIVAPAKLTNLDDPTRNNSVIITTYSDGSQRLSQILLAGKKYALEIRQEPVGKNVADNN